MEKSTDTQMRTCVNQKSEKIRKSPSANIPKSRKRENGDITKMTKITPSEQNSEFTNMRKVGTKKINKR